MGNRKPEQELIDNFMDKIEMDINFGYKQENIINKSCKAHKNTDIEYITNNNEYIIIEAKSNDSNDAPNTIHKIFGEILKETGRDRNTNLKIRYCILLSNEAFYKKGFHEINKQKYIDYGKLIPMDTIFVLENEKIKQYSWKEFYSEKNGGKNGKNL